MKSGKLVDFFKRKKFWGLVALFCIYVTISMVVLILRLFSETLAELRQNPPDVGVTSGQKPCTKTIYIVLQTSVGFF